MDAAHPVQVDGAVILRRDLDEILFHHFNGALRHRLHFDEPLCGKPWFHDRLAAVTFPDRERVVFHADQLAVLFQVGEHALARFKPIQAFIGAGVLIHHAMLIHHIDGGQAVALAHGEIIGIMRGCDLHRTAAELRIRPIIEYERNIAVDEWQAHFEPVHAFVA